MNNPNKKIVIDSSVFIKIFLQETDSDSAKKLIEKIINKSFVILVPDLFFYEIYSIAHNKRLNWHEIKNMLTQYQFFIFTKNINTKLIEKAMNIAKYGNSKSGYPSFYNSTYHALAIDESCTFITSDEKHFNKTHKKFGHIKLLKNV